MTAIQGWFDGACEPRNPGGHATWGALLKLDGREVWATSGYCGHGPKMSNNVAEYTGVIALLEEVTRRGVLGRVVIHGDSKLVIEQLSGRWKVKHGLYVPFYHRAKEVLRNLERQLGGRVLFAWVPREENAECDRLSKWELRNRGVRLRLQPEKGGEHDGPRGGGAQVGPPGADGESEYGTGGYAAGGGGLQSPRAETVPGAGVQFLPGMGRGGE